MPAVVAIGFDIDLTRRPELAEFRDAVLTWGERVAPAEAAAHPEAARFPYLGDGMQMLEREPGRLPELGLLHVFNWGVTLSHGALAGDIPGLGIGATRLAQALVRDLFVSQGRRAFPPHDGARGCGAGADAVLRAAGGAVSPLSPAR